MRRGSRQREGGREGKQPAESRRPSRWLDYPRHPRQPGPDSPKWRRQNISSTLQPYPRRRLASVNTRTAPEDRPKARRSHVADASLDERLPPLQPVEQGVVLVSHLRHRPDRQVPPYAPPVHLRHILHQRQENLQRLSPLGELVVPLREGLGGATTVCSLQALIVSPTSRVNDHASQTYEVGNLLTTWTNAMDGGGGCTPPEGRRFDHD